MKIKRYRGRALGGRRGKFRWTLWSSSDVIAGSTQGYADAGDRDDNLTSVLGGQLRECDGRLFLVRPTILLNDSERVVLQAQVDALYTDRDGDLALADILHKILSDNGEWIEVADV